MLKKLQLMKIVKFTVITKKRLSQLPSITQPQYTKILNLSNVPLTQNEINILKLGLSFTITPKQNMAKLENNIFQYIRKLRLNYHYLNNNTFDKFIVKLESTYKPKLNENADLENISKELEQTKTLLFKTKDNLHILRRG